MARRWATGLGWVVLLVAIGGVANLLSPHGPVPSQTDSNGISPIFSRPAVTTSSSSAVAAVRPTATGSTILYVTATTLNVRIAPNSSADVLLSAARGTPVIAVSTEGGWVEVKLTNGSTGWANGAFLSDAPPQAVVSSQLPSLAPSAPAAPKKQIDRAAIVQALIVESISNYPGNCPCPYNADRAGRSCGRRSAYSKPGGYAPLCYPTDVTDAMVSDYLTRHR